jgi:hypothetical protein
MLSVKYLSTFLEENQEEIDHSIINNINKFERNNTILEESLEKPKEDNLFKKIKLSKYFEVIFHNNIKDFYYDNNIYKENTSNVFTFFNSILIIIDETFHFNHVEEKENIIKDFLKKLDNDLFQMELYNKFGYNKNKRFNKADIQSVLKDSINLRDNNKLYLLKEYLSDYLGINIYVLKLTNRMIDFTNSETYLTKKYDNDYNLYLPNFIIIYDNGIYKPLLSYNKDKSYPILYSENSEIIDNLWRYFNIFMTPKKSEDVISEKKDIVTQAKKYNIELLNCLKIDAIKKLCLDNDILLQKKSDKTGKMINKLKNELVSELLTI